MAALDLNLNPSKRMLRQFGWAALVAFGLLALYVNWKGGLFGFDFGKGARPVSIILAAIAILSAAFAAFAPQLNRPLYLFLAIVTFPIGFVLSYLIMGVIFYGLISPLGLLFRLIKRDALAIRGSDTEESFWVNRPEVRKKESYFRQY